VGDGSTWQTIGTMLVAAHGLVAAGVAYLLVRFHRSYTRGYLRHWAFAFAALAVWLVLELLPNLVKLPYGWLPRWIPQLAAGYLSVLWLLLGTYEVTTGRGIAAGLQRRMTIALIGTAALTATLYAFEPSALYQRLALRVGLPNLLEAIALGAACLLLVRAASFRHGLGPRVLGVALAAAAFQHVHILALHLVAVPGISPVAYGAGMKLADLMISVAMGMGMGIWLLEEERRNAALASREVEHLAYHDALTGLPNRRLLLDRLDQAIAQARRGEEKVVLMFLDLDRFKVINDSLGHAVGDELLCAVSTRLKHRIRSGDTVARIGGDEFALLFSRVSRPTDAVQMADNLLRSLRAPFLIANRELFLTTSLGIAFYPDDGHDGEVLLRHADLAMYTAKEEGRNNLQLFIPAMKDSALEKLELESELRRALSGRELALHFQPVIELASGKVVAVEALVRWPHRERGLIMPDRFLPIAEQLGLLDAIDDWVLAEACRATRSWQQRFGVDLRVAVNLSARTVQRPDFPFQLQQLIDETRLPPVSLVLEITERTAIQNLEVGTDALARLRELGVGIAIDDFGTGYSSLSYLRQFPADTLKIDKSFVSEVLRDTADRAIIRAIVPLAHTLGMRVVAEGVETEAQCELLRELGVDLVQGWYYHRALAPDAVEALLGAGAAKASGVSL
jgi:diguanylate cyclase (GGDEF)-like protein